MVHAFSLNKQLSTNINPFKISLHSNWILLNVYMWHYNSGPIISIRPIQYYRIHEEWERRRVWGKIQLLSHHCCTVAYCFKINTNTWTCKFNSRYVQYLESMFNSHVNVPKFDICYFHSIVKNVDSLFHRFSRFQLDSMLHNKIAHFGMSFPTPKPSQM